jgi:hypothetical protein
MMTPRRGCALLILGLTLALAAPPARAQGGKKAGGHLMHGTVVAVHHDKAGGATLTVRVHHRHHHGNQPAAAHHHADKTLHVDRGTRIEVVHGKQRHPATLEALHEGAEIVFAAKNHHAEHVALVSGHKSKPKP